MKLVVQVKLLPSPEQARALAATLHACNAAANRVSAKACQQRVFSRARLQKLVYAELKASGLSAQPALHVIRKTGENHKISKRIVADAQRTGRGIAVEQLDGIRDRVRLRRHQRATLSNWPFHQLGTFLAYKARRAGVPLLHVDPAYTSQRCPTPWCGHVSRRNRPTRGRFLCVACGLAGLADDIAAVNVRNRARTAWAFVTMPDSDPCAQPTQARHEGRGDAPPARQPAATGERDKA